MLSMTKAANPSLHMAGRHVFAGADQVFSRVYLRTCGQIRARGTVVIQQRACWAESAHPSVSDISFSRDLQSLAPSDMSPWVRHIVFTCNAREQKHDARCGNMQHGKVSLQPHLLYSCHIFVYMSAA